ncbi:MAG: glyoxylate/hydroxypyruvate reductase A [Paracoccaceae bacterium]
MTDILFSSRPEQAEVWAPELRRWSAELETPFTLHTDPAAVDPAKVEMLVLNPVAGMQDLSAYSGVTAIQSIWAGVESFLGNPTLPHGPTLCRMVEPGLTEGMTDYICGHVLRYHLDIDASIRLSAEGRWKAAFPPLSRDRRVGVLGLGALGADAAKMLARMRFDVAGWSRSAKTLDGVTCFHGDEGLRDILARSEIIVTILPATPETRHILNAASLALLPKGAVIINPGRGPLIDDSALLDALNSGHVRHATLDVFETEPLPADHPYWRRADVTVTPHIAAETRASGASRVVVEQIGRMTRGEPLWHIVDREVGY